MDQRAGGDSGNVEEDGAEVLEDEDGAPSDLGAYLNILALRRSRGRNWPTQILDENLARGDDGGFIDEAGLAVLERLLGGRVEEADAVEVANVGRLGD